MAAMVKFASISPEESSIQAWVREQIEDQLKSRLELSGRAAEFMSVIDKNQKEVIGRIKPEAERVSAIVSDFNVVRTQLDVTFAEI